jgi:hypothetical protein
MLMPMISKQQALAAGLLVVPRGVRHRPLASEETHLVLLKPHATPTPATPSWPARSANGSIDHLCRGVQTAPSSRSLLP